ncbi:MAG: hypothetical protein EOO77_00065 [Oxalobacteraceae bacterium]|nr:MAG: hypothetical protein EOO77_00065 [Oxalobacteraceae bacterium]
MRLRSYTGKPVGENDGSLSVASVEDDRVRAILLSSALIDESQLDQIDAQKNRTNQSFREAAVDLGIVSQEVVQQATAGQRSSMLLITGESVVSPAVVAAFDLFDPLTEKLRALRPVIITPAQMTNSKPRIIVISGISGNDTPGIAANFAVVVAQLGYDGLLVDANLSRPTQHHLFGVPNRDGVSTLLTQGPNDAAFVKTQIPHLDLLTAGSDIINVAESLERTSLCGTLRSLRRGYHFVIVDGGTQPIEVAAAMARGSDGVLIIAERGRTQVKRLKQAIGQMESREIDVLGTILAR